MRDRLLSMAIGSDHLAEFVRKVSRCYDDENDIMNWWHVVRESGVDIEDLYSMHGADEKFSAWVYMDKIGRSKGSLAEAFMAANPNGQVCLEEYRISGNTFMGRLIEHIEEPVAHLIAAMSFGLNDWWRDSYCPSWSNVILKREEKRINPGALAALIYLHKCVSRGEPLKDECDKLLTLYKHEDVVERLDMLMEAVVHELEQMNVVSSFDKAAAISDAERKFGKETAVMLEKMLEKIQIAPPFGLSTIMDLEKILAKRKDSNGRLNGLLDKLKETFMKKK